MVTLVVDEVSPRQNKSEEIAKALNVVPLIEAYIVWKLSGTPRDSGS